MLSRFNPSRLLVALSLSLGAVSGASAQSEPAAPAQPAKTRVDDALINTPDASAWNVYGNGQTSEKVACEMLNKRCLRVSLKDKMVNAWDIGAQFPIFGAIRKNDRVEVLVFGRLLSGDANATATVNLSIQLAAPPYTSVITGPVTLSTQPQPLIIQGKAEEGFAEGTTSVTFQLGHLGQAVEFSAPVVLRNYKRP
jgi:endoglucanase